MNHKHYDVLPHNYPMPFANFCKYWIITCIVSSEFVLAGRLNILLDQFLLIINRQTLQYMSGGMEWKNTIYFSHFLQMV